MNRIVEDPLFHCDRRDMPVAKDTTDCQGCPMRTYPTPCQQFAYWHREVLRGRLGYKPDIFIDIPPPPDVTE